jgi:hypothetical protein
MRKKERGEDRWRIPSKTANNKMCIHVSKQFIVKGGQRIKFRKAAGRSGKEKAIRELITEM